MKPLHFVLSSFVLLSSAAPSYAAQQSRVVFIRGADGTGGFLGGGSDEQLSDINNFSTNGGNHGFGELSQLLAAEGFTVEQVIESTSGAPVDFAALDLSTVDVLVLGSNNQTYPPADVQAVTDFVHGGGGLLVISDANWGSNWGSAPSSDQPFLDPYGLVMNQDKGTYRSNAADGDHVFGLHPILSGEPLGADPSQVALEFDGEGVSPLTVGPTPPGVHVQILARAEGQIRVNDAPGSGSMRPSGADDAALVVAYHGQGVVVGHFDRNTFFNQNGAGTSINRLDNTTYARNLFRFLRGPVPQPYGTALTNSAGGEAALIATRTAGEVTLVAYGALPDATAYFAVGTERAALPLGGGQLLVGGSAFRFGLDTTDAAGSLREVVPLAAGSTAGTTLTFQLLYRDSGTPSGFGLSNAIETLPVL